MKHSEKSMVARQARAALLGSLSIALGIGCSSAETDNAVQQPPPTTVAPDGTVLDMNGDPVVGPDGQPVMQAPVVGPVDMTPPDVVDGDPGRVGINRLNNNQYNNTLRDLLGTGLRPATAFPASREAFGFDNIAAASVSMTDIEYEGYFNAARAVTDDVFATPQLLASLMTCQPDAADPAACASQILNTFASRAYRRLVTQDELTRLLGVFNAVLATSDFTTGLKAAVRAILSSPSFLYRVETDQMPGVATPHSLTAYELATRLSYFQWNSMPDAALFQAAADGSLFDRTVLTQQVDRMLADPKSLGFLESFAGQWLDFRVVTTHSVTEYVYPEFTPSLATAMADEARYFFSKFLYENVPLNQFFTLDVNYVNGELAAHYGFTGVPAGSPAQEIVDATDQRQGFLGLASILTTTSFPGRTSPTLRAQWILAELLCTELHVPAGLDIAPLEDAVVEGEEPGGEIQNVRKRLEAHRANPTCAACHNVLDPIGLGLENFDGIGRYRTEYPGTGGPIDSSGTLPPNDAPFSNLLELSNILAQDARFNACISQKLLTYALGRGVDPMSDAPYLAQLAADDGTPLTLRTLIHRIVENDTFRFRRGELAEEAMASATQGVQQ